MAPSIFLCAGSAEVSVQIGGIMPLHLQPTSFRGEMGSPKQSTENPQGACKSHIHH